MYSRPDSKAIILLSGDQEEKHENGCIVPAADNETAFSVVGGIVMGIDNGKSDSHGPFKSNKLKVNAGICLAVVKRKGENNILQH